MISRKRVEISMENEDFHVPTNISTSNIEIVNKFSLDVGRSSAVRKKGVKEKNSETVITPNIKCQSLKRLSLVQLSSGGSLIKLLVHFFTWNIL